MTSTTSETFFDAKYRADPDPWDFATNTYELDRYDRIVGVLDNRRFALAYEPGCSVGVLTAKLSEKCDQLEACEISPTAVELARRRCETFRNVRVHHASLIDFVPRGADLYVFSEVGYYLTGSALAALLQQHVDALVPGALLVACHWRGISADHLLSGDEVHELIHNTTGLTHEYSEIYEQFRLDRWAKR